MPERKSTFALPSRVQAALDYLNYCHWATHQCDASIPARSLSNVEVGVQNSALQVLRLYFDGEMDYGDAPPAPSPPEDDDPGTGAAVNQPA